MHEFLPDPRFLAIARFIAHELGDTTTFDRLDSVVQRDYEPRWFGEDDARFGYFFGWDDTYPRGQPNALLLMPELGGPGAWAKPFTSRDPGRFSEPTVEGVDYPSLGVAEARNDPVRGELHVRTYAATPACTGRETTWRVVNLPDPGEVQVLLDGRPHAGWKAIGPDSSSCGPASASTSSRSAPAIARTPRRRTRAPRASDAHPRRPSAPAPS